MVAYIKTKKKVDVKPAAIKEQLALFIRCDIENPAFDSQTKDYMNTPMAKFGSSCEVSDKFIEKLAKEDANLLSFPSRKDTSSTEEALSPYFAGKAPAKKSTFSTNSGEIILTGPPPFVGSEK